jgi:hypothetical protein
MKRTSSEFDLWKRRIVYVADYLDEGNEVPAAFVQRDCHGRFEAVTTDFDEEDVCIEVYLGIFDDLKQAVRFLHKHLRDEFEREFMGELRDAFPFRVV